VVHNGGGASAVFSAHQACGSAAAFFSGDDNNISSYLGSYRLAWRELDIWVGILLRFALRTLVTCAGKHGIVINVGDRGGRIWHIACIRNLAQHGIAVLVMARVTAWRRQYERACGA